MRERSKTRLQDSWIKVNGVDMHARFAAHAETRDAATVVLVHGLSVSSGYMVPTAELLAPSYHVYAPDLPGFGKSAKPSHILSIPQLADALADWMEALELPPAILLGNSLGCQVIAHFALRYPERITHAVLVGPTMDPKMRNLPMAALRLGLDMYHEPLSFWPVVTREYLAAGPRRTLGTLQYAFDDPIELCLPKVQVPTLVVRGAYDALVGQSWTEEVHRLIPQSRLVIVPGAAHAVNFNSPDQLVSAMQTFLSEYPLPALQDASIS
jgi:pimeloyl-ACP methyl ester carboxylesterase